ncbi:MAG TPA: transporter [Gemmatimonadaceae bacterium]
MPDPTAVPSPLVQVLLLSLIPVATTAAGATVAAIRPPGPGTRSAIQHFAAGVVFSVVAVELLPDVTRVHDLVEIGWTFAAGLVLMLLIERAAKRLGGGKAAVAERGGRVNFGQLAGIAIDVLVDGLLVGIAFAAGTTEGLLLTGALAIELLSLGLAMAAGLAAAGASRLRTIILPTAIAALLVVGALAGDTVLRGASEHTLAGVLSFGSAALLYLVTEELLVEAHEAPETTFTTSMFFAGFLLFLLLGMLDR